MGSCATALDDSWAGFVLKNKHGASGNHNRSQGVLRSRCPKPEHAKSDAGSQVSGFSNKRFSGDMDRIKTGTALHALSRMPADASRNFLPPSDRRESLSKRDEIILLPRKRRHLFRFAAMHISCGAM